MSTTRTSQRVFSNVRAEVAPQVNYYQLNQGKPDSQLGCCAKALDGSKQDWLTQTCAQIPDCVAGRANCVPNVYQEACPYFVEVDSSRLTFLRDQGFQTSLQTPFKLSN
jgi:hypothetical protein